MSPRALYAAPKFNMDNVEAVVNDRKDTHLQEDSIDVRHLREIGVWERGCEPRSAARGHLPVRSRRRERHSYHHFEYRCGEIRT